MSAVPMPLWAAIDQYQQELSTQLARFLMWLYQTEAAMPEGYEAALNVMYESPFTPGGPFIQIPKAVISATVVYKGFAFRTAASGKEPERRAMTLGLQSMQTTPNVDAAVKRIVHNLTWYSKPESELLPS